MLQTVALQFICAKKLALALGCSLPWVRKATRQGKLPCLRCGRAVRYSLDAVTSALQKTNSPRRSSQPPDLEARDRERFEHEIEALRCVYCKQLVNADEDAQRVNKREYAHTPCAFAADEAFFFFHFDSSESEHD